MDQIPPKPKFPENETIPDPSATILLWPGFAFVMVLFALVMGMILCE